MVTEINKDNFTEKVLENKQPVVVKIYTNSCSNCKILAPIFIKTAKKNKSEFSFYKINAKHNIEIAKQYKIMGVPSLLFFSHGKLVDKKTGVINQKKIEKKLFPLVNFTQEIADSKEITSMFRLPWRK